jgi:hypothetical protein
MAYTKMVSAGIKSTIPAIYGYMCWPSSQWTELFPHIPVYDSDVYAIVTEFLDESFVDMDPDNVGPQRAARAVMALEDIHQAGILHGKVDEGLRVNPRNNRVLWTGFENCRFSEEYKSKDLETEMQYVMSLIYGYNVCFFRSC